MRMEKATVTEWLNSDVTDRLNAGNHHNDPRAEVLSGAISCVLKNRNNSYGEPEDNFERIITLWNAWMKVRQGGEFTKADQAVMMIMVKLARIAEAPAHLDSWTDTAGYAACGYRCAKQDAEGYTSPPPETAELETPQKPRALIDIK